MASGFTPDLLGSLLAIQPVMFPGRPQRLRTFDYLGLHRYSLTFCTHNRQKHFTNSDVVTLVLSQIARAAAENGFAVIAYCFMPDHLHLLVEGLTDASDCKRFIVRAKQYSGFYYSKQYNGVLWQRYGFEHVLRDEDITLVVARYILENPIRGGLVQRVEDYPFVGSLEYKLSDLLDGLVRSG